jgi:TPR repeat protein
VPDTRNRAAAGTIAAAGGTLLAAGLALVLLAVPARAEKERPWLEIESPSFRLVTDAGANAGRRTARRFEQIRAALETALPKARMGEHPFTIVAARDESSLRALVPAWWERPGGVRPAAVFQLDPHFPVVLLRVDIPESEDEQDRYAQAYWGYAAHLVTRVAPDLPLWAERGLAQFYAHTTVQADKVLLGRASLDDLRTLKEDGLMPSAALLAVDRSSPDYLDEKRLRRFDAQSWLLVHYLMLGDKGAHRSLLGQLVTRASGGPQPAVPAAQLLGDLRQLDRALETYLRNRGFYMESVPLAAPASTETSPERPLSPAQVHVLRATIHLASDRRADARSQLDAALRLDPDLAAAHEALASLLWRQNDPVAARREAERAQQLAPDRPLAREILQQMSEHVLVQLPGASRLGRAPTLAALERQCETADLEACWLLAGTLIDGRGVPANAARGVALAEQACDGGKADACVDLAARFRDGRGVARDAARSLSLQEKACQLGKLQECLGAASDYENGEGVSPDVARADRLYSTACDHGEVTGCTALAWALLSGEHMPKDAKRATALLEKACAAKDGSSCVRAGIIYFEGTGVAKNLRQAATLFEAGCAAGQAAGCANLGRMHGAGLGVPRDPVKAAALLGRACQAGDPSACAEAKPAATARPRHQP